MWRIKQMLELNSGKIEVVFGDEIEKVMVVFQQTFLYLHLINKSTNRQQLF
jgi:hypothetical protein